MEDSTKQILEIVTDIQERMAVKDETAGKEDLKKLATKDDLERVHRELQAQITENTKAIAELAEQIRSVLGYAKEIDMLAARVAAIEKHVGIK